jgi:hypothetical protein
MPRTSGTCFKALGAWLGVLVLACFVACGGGGSTPRPAAPLSLSMAGSVSLPVATRDTASEAKGYYAQPYSGTTTVTINRDGTVSGYVQLTVSGLPTNVVASFAKPSTTATSDELSLQIGRPDPTDTTYTRQLYPTPGTYTVTISASGTSTSGSVLAASKSFQLVLTQEQPAMALGITDDQGQNLLDPTVVTLGSAGVTEYFAAYQVNNANFATQGPVILSLSDVPSGLDVSLDATSVEINYIHSLTITPKASLAPGFYAFTLKAVFGSHIATLPLVVKYSPYPFYIQTPASDQIQVLQGGSITFPLYLGHADAFFSMSGVASGDDPAYVGTTQLSATGLPAGITATFGDPNPTGLGSVPLTLAAAPSVDPGSYLVRLQATRTGAGGVAGATPVVQTIDLPLSVGAAALGSAPRVWVQAVEWGQTVLSPGLPLVAGKQALLAVQILADQPSSPAVSFSVVFQDGSHLALKGPSFPPSSAVEGGINGSNPSVYSVVVPANLVTTSLSATLHTDSGILADTALPVTVLPATTCALTLVPIVTGGSQPSLPTTDTVAEGIQAYWPISHADVTVRAPYTTSTTFDYGSTASNLETVLEDGWIQLLSELATLRITDASARTYYGMFNPVIPDSFRGSTVVGLTRIGGGAGIGMDRTCAALFENPDAPVDNSVMILVHELGHTFNLEHAPAGGAGGPQLDYPYAGAMDGVWGIDVPSLTLRPPTQFDVMSYASGAHWVSDWDYLAAMAWLEGGAGTAGLADLGARTGVQDRWVVSGWIDASGQAHLAPLLRTTCADAPPQAGSYRLVLHTTQGDVTVPFAAQVVPDLPGSVKHFAFAVPASGDVESLEVQGEGRTLLTRAPRETPSGARTLKAEASTPEVELQEEGGVLRLTWDATRHPYASVFHEGGVRTALAFHLQGGHAELPVALLPPGGSFRIHLSDGLRETVQVVDR